MAKERTVFICQHCGAQHSKWMGKCTNCGSWNTIVEELQLQPSRHKAAPASKGLTASAPVQLNDFQDLSQSYAATRDPELNRVLGGGIVNGGVVLLAGDPGIGKSTLLLQLALSFEDKKVLYVSGEESVHQIQLRAGRISQPSENVWLLAETDTNTILKELPSLKPEVIIIDSIQTLHSPYIESAAGTISQVKQCAAELVQYAKTHGVPTFLIGHINKDGGIAGPKVLEHMVDTVLQFEGDRNMSYRLLRTIKNRFGSTQELGIYQMFADGLRVVEDPSELLVSQRDEDSAGVAISASIEGNRTLLVEIQALVSPATYSTPQRSATGYDPRRLNMILAVLEKKCGYRLGVEDVFLNVAGGIRIEDPSIDLAVAAALVSSLNDQPVSGDICFIGEIGLTGEIRAVNRIDTRLTEVERLGYKQAIISSYSKLGSTYKNLKIRKYSQLSAMFRDIM